MLVVGAASQREGRTRAELANSKSTFAGLVSTTGVASSTSTTKPLRRGSAVRWRMLSCFSPLGWFAAASVANLPSRWSYLDTTASFGVAIAVRSIALASGVSKVRQEEGPRSGRCGMFGDPRYRVATAAEARTPRPDPERRRVRVCHASLAAHGLGRSLLEKRFLRRLGEAHGMMFRPLAVDDVVGEHSSASRPLHAKE
jgi:hypothetical protein